MRLLTAAIVSLSLTVLALAQEAKTFAGEVTATSLRLRAGPGEAYQPVVQLERGSRVIVLGKHANNPSWYRVEVPGGYRAWVFSRFVAKGKDGVGLVTAKHLLVRPRPSTRYHQLEGVLERNERVKILDEKTTEAGTWYLVRVPQRIPLYAHVTYLRKIGPASLAKAPPATEEGPALEPVEPGTDADKRFLALEPDVRLKLVKVTSVADLRPLRQAVRDVDRTQLSVENRERRVKLLADIVETEHKLAILEVQRKEKQVKGDLDAKLREIDRRYRLRLSQIREEFEATRTPRYVASGIVRWAPDIFGRHPAYRLVEGGRMRSFLIAPDFDLAKFRGKRVGVTGITDPESGTGYVTVMVRRIEILGNE